MINYNENIEKRAKSLVDRSKVYKSVPVEDIIDDMAPAVFALFDIFVQKAGAETVHKRIKEYQIMVKDKEMNLIDVYLMFISMFTIIDACKIKSESKK